MFAGCLIALGLVAVAGAAHALSCAEPHEEIALEIESVEADGVAQADLEAYSSRSVVLQVVAPEDRAPGYGFVELLATEGGYFIYSEAYDAASAGGL